MSKRKEAFRTSALSKPGHQHAERLKSNSRRQHASRADAIHLKRACVVDTNVNLGRKFGEFVRINLFCFY